MTYGALRPAMTVVMAMMVSAGAALAQTTSELDFASGIGEFRQIREQLPNLLRQEAEQLLSERRQEIATIKTLGDVEQRKAAFRERMIRRLGGFPERTPLNVKSVGVIDRDGYRIEKIIFESRPGFYVTANLYLPKTGRPPFPAILYPLGHESGAKAHAAWQIMMGTLATRGFVVLTWDPLGQGERIQLYDEDLQDSKVGMATTEHTVLGIQCLLTGSHLAMYTIWDGMRALDYLLSRPEVDPARVGCTGNSGGGTHTAYLAALDDRIKVAAPSCYITSWGRMLESLGPQDAEQSIPFWLHDRLDFPDYLHAFAPKPYLVLSAIRDFFPIGGARETFQEAKRIYASVGAEDKLQMFEADDRHGYTAPRRLAAYQWFGRWLQGVDDRQPEPAITISSERELWCTPTGQVATSLRGETVFSLNQKRFAQAKRPALSAAEMRQRAAEVTGFKLHNGPLNMRNYGRTARDGYSVEKLTYESEPGVTVPALLYLPAAAPARRAVIYIDGDGKSGATPHHERLTAMGFAVLAIDARDLGETSRRVENEHNAFYRYFGNYNATMTALLIGRTMVGMRAQDIVRGVEVLQQRSDLSRPEIYGFGKGSGAVPMLYAAALDTRIREVGLTGLLDSYQTLVENRIHRRVFEHVVPGVLNHFDLADLASAIAPRGIWIGETVNGLGYEVERNRHWSSAARRIPQWASFTF